MGEKVDKPRNFMDELLDDEGFQFKKSFFE